MKASILPTSNSQTEVLLNDALFGAPVNQVLLAQAIRVYRACLRQGTAKTKTRAEINRTHKKWFKQKGTGNARHGARTPNIFVGGGVSHGPTGHENWWLDMSQTMRRQALVCALSAQAAHVYVTEIPAEAKVARKLLAGDFKTLVILSVTEQEVIRGIRNMSTILITTADRLTALDVVSADRVILTSAAMTKLEARLLNSSNSEALKPEVVTAETTTSVIKASKKPAAPKKLAVPKKPPAPKKVTTKKMLKA